MGDRPSLIRRWGVRLFRAGVLIAFVLALRFQSGGGVPEESTLDVPQVRALFPMAFDVRPGEELTAVRDEGEATLGFAVKTLPESRKIIGYAGPADVLVALDGDGVVTGTKLLWSGDTPEHSAAVRDTPDFFNAFAGWSFGDENDAAAIDAVSGATLTSLAIIQSVAVRLGGAQPSLKFPEPVSLEAAQRLFPDAVAIGEASEGSFSFPAAINGEGRTIGQLLRSAPDSDAIMGYQGPSDSLIGIAPDNTIAGITLGATYDNQRYADYVREDRYFTRRHRGLSLADLAALDGSRFEADGVSGATMTSVAVMEGAVHRVKSLLADGGTKDGGDPVNMGMPLRLRDGITLLAIVLACAVAFTRARAYHIARVGLYLYLVLALGLWVGDMVSLAVLGGWVNGAVPWRGAPGLVALVAAAFVLPWGTGKPVYCQQLCPHGAAQALLYGFVPGRLRVPVRLHRFLVKVPFLILAVGVVVAALGLPVSLSALEPFDAWIFGIGGFATIIIAVVGLVASAFVPQAYCKYGCPTGLVLDYARTRRHEGHLTRRDAWAVGLLAVAIVLGMLGP